MEGSHTASTARRGRPEHEIAPRPRPCDATTRLRLPQRSHGPAASRQRACRAAAVRQAAAARATIRPPTSRILWSYGEIRQSGSAEGGRWVLRRTDCAHLSSTHEPWCAWWWCPRDEVRSRPGRPLRRPGRCLGRRRPFCHRLRAPSSRHTVVGSVDGGGARASTPAIGGRRWHATHSRATRAGHRMKRVSAWTRV